jgi:hypothetical protein
MNRYVLAALIGSCTALHDAQRWIQILLALVALNFILYCVERFKGVDRIDGLEEAVS